MPARMAFPDPEPVVLSVNANILEHGGYTVGPIDTAIDAWEMVKTVPPDLLLTNVYLPGIHGCPMKA